MIEGLLNPDRPTAGSAMNLRMYSFFGGRERTAADLSALAATVGLKLTDTRTGRVRSLLRYERA